MSDAAARGLTVAEWLALPLLLAGVFFFVAGTVGLLRFPDAHARLHALAKADNLGLGLLAAGLALEAESVAVVLKLALIWAFALIGSASAAYHIAGAALGDGEPRGAGADPG